MSKRAKHDSGVERLSMIHISIPQPPVDLNDHELSVWRDLMATKDPRSFTPVDLQMASILAKTIVQCRDELDNIAEEGSLVPDSKGHLKENPRLKVWDTLCKHSTSLTRLLSLHSLATTGQSQRQRKRHAEYREQ